MFAELSSGHGHRSTVVSTVYAQNSVETTELLSFIEDKTTMPRRLSQLVGKSGIHRCLALAGMRSVCYPGRFVALPNV